jgi:3-oxoacyl-[acyl-carrier-protein] synthase III
MAMILFIKMDGHLIYKYAVRTVPLVIKKNLEKAGLHLRDVNKILIHQANEKMDMAIVKRLFKLYGIEEIDPEHYAHDNLLVRKQFRGNTSHPFRFDQKRKT